MVPPRRLRGPPRRPRRRSQRPRRDAERPPRRPSPSTRSPPQRTSSLLAVGAVVPLGREPWRDRARRGGPSEPAERGAGSLRAVWRSSARGHKAPGGATHAEDCRKTSLRASGRVRMSPSEGLPGVRGPSAAAVQSAPNASSTHTTAPSQAPSRPARSAPPPLWRGVRHNCRHGGHRRAGDATRG